MYKVNSDGSIEVSTLDEALELQRRIRSEKPKFQLQIRSKTEPKVNGHEHTFDDEVFKKLRPHDGQIIDSAVMKEIIGAKTEGGVGPKLYHLKNRTAGLEDVLHERKDARGHTSWKVKFP